MSLMKRSIFGGLLLALSGYAQAASLVVLPRQLVVDSSGAPRSGALLYTYSCGTTTPLTTYTTQALATAHANPVVSVSTGLFPAIYTAANVTCVKVVLKDSSSVTIYTEDNIPTGSSDSSFEYDIRSAGVVADSTSARAANCTAFQDLVDATAAGVEGRIVFPNLTGTTTYYFAPCAVEIRDRITLDLNGSTLDFAGAYDASLDTYGFLACIRDCTIENGTLNVDYDGSTGTNNGNGIRLGARRSYEFAGSSSFDEEALTSPMGNIVLRNLKIVFNNPDTAAPLLMLGGLENVTVENVTIDGAGVALKSIYYEWGDYHYEATAANRTTSHARNMVFKNIVVTDVASAAVGPSVVGALNVVIDGLYVDSGANLFIGRAGEALYYNMGAPFDGYKPHYDLRNLYGSGLSSTGLGLTGAELATGGYLSATIAALADEPEWKAQTDQITFSVDGCTLIDASILLSATATIRNCHIDGAGSGGIIITDEAIDVLIENSKIVNSGGIGIRASFGSNVWTPVRPKRLTVRNSIIAGNTGEGITLGNANGSLIENVRCGYLEALDDLTETTQTTCISNTSTSLNLTARGVYVAAVASGSAYTNATSGGWKYAKVESPGGLRTISGPWTIDGFGTDGDLGDAGCTTTLDPGTDLPFQRCDTTLTATRTITLGACNAAANGTRYRITRTGLGAFNLVVTSVKTITGAVAAFIDTSCNGTAWTLDAYGTL